MVAGRKRAFDKQKALSRAMEVFWLKGYNGASLSDLTEAMEINKPSLYAAFGNKEELFVSAINEYVNAYGLPHFDKLIEQGSSLKDRVQAYLESIVGMLTDSKLPGGCFVASSTCEVGSKCLPKDAVRAVLEVNEESTKAFVSFFETEQAKGNLPQDASPQILADYLLTTQFGLAVMARDGIKRKRLESVVSHVVSGF
jgi:AcrR family transcriptional regulator